MCWTLSHTYLEVCSLGPWAMKFHERGAAKLVLKYLQDCWGRRRPPLRLPFTGCTRQSFSSLIGWKGSQGPPRPFLRRLLETRLCPGAACGGGTRPSPPTRWSPPQPRPPASTLLQCRSEVLLLALVTTHTRTFFTPCDGMYGYLSDILQASKCRNACGDASPRLHTLNSNMTRHSSAPVTSPADDHGRSSGRDAAAGHRPCRQFCQATDAT